MVDFLLSERIIEDVMRANAWKDQAFILSNAITFVATTHSR